MSLLARIRADALTARKARDTDTATLLVTLHAEAAKVGKDAGNRDSTDAEVLDVVRKFVKNNDDTLRALWTPEKLDTNAERRARRDKLQLEQAVLFGYLPAQVSAGDIDAAIKEILPSLPDRTPKQMGVVMAELKRRYEGNFDKALASNLIKQALAA